ncbi:peroxiredoxin [Sinomonas cellulolyticus]|uniref:Peroxiredoxin n=1 Tax=Sinomonas cellulolyticus TaxID=2801916 RepID=A0ABS1K4B3_9MICC|nr:MULTISPECIES: peroxiredoxin [Sinomonas]MBL0706360.1 peroxiredoxin [Sinomonas cellulolyticus]GHG44236.1 peroxiredoxin [Sinomonas sp. KCTC 49339]
MTAPLGAASPAVGELAPDFELPNQFGEPVRLSAFRGRPVVVIFFPFAFSGICTGELCEIRDGWDAFADVEAEVLAVSVDSKFAQRAYAAAEGYEFSLLADFWPHGEVARRYGVFDEASGMALRGTFILDAEGVVRYRVVNPRGQARDMQEYRAALAEISAQAPHTSA